MSTLINADESVAVNSGLVMEKPSAEIAQKGGRFKPLKLKSVLADFGISQAEWGRAVKQDNNGQPLSGASQTKLLRWNMWLKKTSAESIKKQTAEFLQSHSVPDAVIATVWDEETDNSKRGKHTTTSNKKAHRVWSAAGLDKTLINELPRTEMLSRKAKQHFNLFSDPFRNDVNGPDDVFLSTEQTYIRESMRHAAMFSGFLAVIGESGAGKSTLRRDLIDYINREGEKVRIIQPRIIDKGRLSAGAICDAIIQDISVDAYLPRTLEAKARKIEQLLINSARGGNSHCLMIEEAHDLSVPTLKYLKRFWELEDGHTKLLGIVLVGQPELKMKLDERANFEAREVIRRIEVAELLPLDNELESYVAKKFARVRLDPSAVLADNAYDAIRQRLTFTRGGGTSISMVYPLVVNNTITKAMNLAAELGEPAVSAELVKEV